MTTTGREFPRDERAESIHHADDTRNGPEPRPYRLRFSS